MKPACEPVLFSPLGSKSHSLFLASFNCTMNVDIEMNEISFTQNVGIFENV